MKTPFLLVFLFLTASAHAQVSISAKPASTSKTSRTAWATSYGSHDTTVTRSVALDVLLSNTGTNDRQVKLTLYVFGPDMSLIERSPCGTVTVPAGRQVPHVVRSEESSRRVEEYRALRQTYISGAAPIGWAVLARGPGITNAAASSLPIKTFVLDPDKLGPLDLREDRLLVKQLQDARLPVPPHLLR